MMRRMKLEPTLLQQVWLVRYKAAAAAARDEPTLGAAAAAAAENTAAAAAAAEEEEEEVILKLRDGCGCVILKDPVSLDSNEELEDKG